ncbi:iron-containing alcohol dehydrogenase [Bordetella petrii]|uniref:iron-containing alcohol dehydrogenase n=1 Tax=Bordetella petrii TaxID=94624 RepID=UPI001E35E43D|nr:iron-containing alcohol dehydrogenase [Bordetella petrii]MCD0502658.1 iron-containing alcohol dehydrogenase [Bordetella petrii]
MNMAWAGDYFCSGTHAVRVHGGPAALDRLGSELRRAGVARAMVLCGRSVAAHGNWLRTLNAQADGCIVGVCGAISKDAPLEDVQRAVEQARELGADCLVAIGSGSVLKAARVVAILLAETAPLMQLITHYPDQGPAISPKLTAPKIPIFNILTAPTSAQNRAGSAIKGPGGQGRYEFFDPRTRPRAIFWDPAALATAPLSLIRSTGYAVFWRALMNMGGAGGANPLVEGARIQAWRLARRAYPQALDSAEQAAMLRGRMELCAAALLQNRDEDDGGRPMDQHWIARAVYALAAGVFHAIPSIGQGEAHAALTAAAVLHAPASEDAVIGRLWMALVEQEPDGVPACEPGREQVAQEIEEAHGQMGMPADLSALGVRMTDLPRTLDLSTRNFNADRDRTLAGQRACLEAVLMQAMTTK